MKKIYLLCVCSVFLMMSLSRAWAQKNKSPKFKVIVMAEMGDRHRPYVDAALAWLEGEAKTKNFTVDHIENAEKINDAFLSQYQLFIQLNYPPYMWSDSAKASFERYINEGRGGWIGFHHATLLGEFDGYAMWPWFHQFMGSIRFKNYIATFVSATANVEDKKHPVMKNIPAKFFIEKEEFYTYDASPRPNVHVLASVDESTYAPNSDVKMGDHPIVWTNTKVKARNVYIFMGHDPVLFNSKDYKTLFSNAIAWASQK
ncbi:ThuA domain-containing protein [Chryseolinea soli]|uniref:ThuA domain-containing protein n=1 Tax=Chryseolinea soli TaxID=2321403 RepID=A0A385SU20_9BACT|nr:ThuA domain-containing protein [Chryseolinea soli]AYB33781.1 ThuA domain-containing protein [Chryseolinea soli]